ncbi:MAG: cysteine--tRNA ligase, partial [Rhabdaerophilum sp.]
MTANIKLYNTLTRQKDPLKPLAINPATGKELVRMYVCGPTVYDFAHIGNARPVIVFDVLFRLLRLRYGAENVIYTRNITDVDDKINDRAARDFPGLPLNEAIRRVTEGTNGQFQADVKALGNLEPTHQPRATEHIGDMVEIIEKLIAKGFAYVAEGSEGKEVLFSVSSMPRYGQLSNRKLEEQEAGARVAVEAHKRNPGDFVLWKQSSADQPGWEASF